MGLRILFSSLQPHWSKGGSSGSRLAALVRYPKDDQRHKLLSLNVVAMNSVMEGAFGMNQYQDLESSVICALPSRWCCHLLYHTLPE